MIRYCEECDKRILNRSLLTHSFMFFRCEECYKKEKKEMEYRKWKWAYDKRVQKIIEERKTNDKK